MTSGQPLLELLESRFLQVRTDSRCSTHRIETGKSGYWKRERRRQEREAEQRNCHGQRLWRFCAVIRVELLRLCYRASDSVQMEHGKDRTELDYVA